jgi:hypothetical protein
MPMRSPRPAQLTPPRPTDTACTQPHRPQAVLWPGAGAAAAAAAGPGAPSSIQGMAGGGGGAAATDLHPSPLLASSKRWKGYSTFKPKHYLLGSSREEAVWQVCVYLPTC